MPRNVRQRLGRQGEEMAARLLRDRGYRILARNVHASNWGEIDILAEQDDFLIVVEVRTRRGNRFGSAEESIGRAKQERLAQLALWAVDEYAWEGSWRVDVVTIQMDGRGKMEEMRLLVDAVEDIS